MHAVRINNDLGVAEVAAIRVGRHLFDAGGDALHQILGIHGVEAGSHQRMINLRHHPDDLVRPQIAVVLDGDFHVVLFDEGQILFEFRHQLGTLHHGLWAHAGMGQLLSVFHIGAELHQLRADGVANLNGPVDGGVDAGITGGVEGDVQLQLYAQLLGQRLDMGQMLRGGVVVQIHQCDMENVDPFLHGKFHQLIQRQNPFKRMDLSGGLKAPALSTAAEVQGIAVHTEFEFTSCVVHDAFLLFCGHSGGRPTAKAI